MSWFNFSQNLAYVSSWNGSNWNSPVVVGIGAPPIGDPLADLFLSWDSVRGRFVFVGIDSQGSSWTVALSPAFASSSTIHWDRPSVGVDAAGRVIIGGVKFQFNPVDNKFEDAGFFAAVDSTGAGTALNPVQIGGTAGALSRVVATNGTFEAFIPALVGDFNQMTSIFRMESTDGSSWAGPSPSQPSRTTRL